MPAGQNSTASGCHGGVGRVYLPRLLICLPIGQLDGGHIIYALGSEDWHQRVGLAFLLTLGRVAGFFYWPWWFWGGAMFFLGRRHPLIYDAAPLSRERKWLCWAALAIFLLSVTVVPVRSV